MKRLLILLFIVSLFGCSKPQWHQTTEGRYIYGDYDDDYNLVWNGPSNIAFVDGAGTLSLVDNHGKLQKSYNITTKMGTVSDYSYVNTAVGNYLGEKKDGLPNGFGVLINGDSVTIGYYKKGNLSSGKYAKYQIRGKDLLPLSIGTVKKGKVSGVAKEYIDGKLVYEGSFKRGVRSGIGQEYNNGVLVYDGEWKDGKRDGNGIQFKDNGLVLYQGEWEDGKYDGYGKLYENGICKEGKWKNGRLKRSISESFFSEITNATKLWFSPDSLNVEKNVNVEDSVFVASSQYEFFDLLYSDLKDYLHEKIDRRVEKRFGFWNLLRMIFQPWFSSDVRRAEVAQDYFCKDVSSKEVQNWINEKIDFYNDRATDKLSYIELDELPDDAIVDTNVALKIFDREAIETTDVGIGILVDILICVVFGFIIGLIIGLFIPPLLPFVGLLDLILTVIGFGIGLYLSVFRTTAISLELEDSIKQMIVDNYMLFIDSQNIISQMLGL